MGNPHAVTWVEDVAAYPVEAVGRQVETHAAFPRRTNTEFVQLISPREVRQRTWERGCGETLACGTGACAVVVAGVLTGRLERDVLLHLSGGDLRVRWDEVDDHVYLGGPAVEVYEGRWPGEK
jgi:diaminopimelate epimerase